MTAGVQGFTRAGRALQEKTWPCGGPFYQVRSRVQIVFPQSQTVLSQRADLDLALGFGLVQLCASFGRAVRHGGARARHAAGDWVGLFHHA